MRFFLVDSDLILHPALVEYLRKPRRALFQNCSGRKAAPGARPAECMAYGGEAPNSDKRNAALYKKKADRRKKQFADRLKVSGIYEAGGLGSCTYIDKEAMDKGTRFVPARNPSQNTEEIFSVSSRGTMDIPLFVDTQRIRPTIFMGRRIWRELWIISAPAEEIRCASYGEKKKAGLN